MTLTEFIAKKQKTWDELEALLNHSRGASGGSPQSGRVSIPTRYVRFSGRPTRFPHKIRGVPYLNALASRAHAAVYQTSPFKRGSLRQFLLSGFPNVFRENLNFIGAAFVMFAVSFSAAYWIALNTPEFAEQLVPERFVSHIKELEDGVWNDTSAENRNLFASFVMTNNIRVAFFSLRWRHHIHGRQCLHFSSQRYCHRCCGRSVSCQRGCPRPLVICIAARLY